FLLENEMFAVAVNRIYYGMFFALSALALKHQFSTSKHGQLIGWFNKNFVKEGKVKKRIGHLIRMAFDSRSASDYDDWVEFSQEEVVVLFEGMKEFIQEMERLIQE
ncbi:MAG: HEPN domain-containing protein, partial [Desulfococcaceae bacterium]